MEKYGRQVFYNSQGSFYESLEKRNWNFLNSIKNSSDVNKTLK